METILPVRVDSVTTNRFSSSAKDKNRRIKAHRKSRRGCGNCKLRRVKCDEGRPKCQKCTSFGVFCNYDGQSSDLQPSVGEVSSIETLQIVPYSLKQTLPSVIIPSLRALSPVPLKNGDTLYEFRQEDFELLKKFQTRTVFTVTTDNNLYLYQKETFKLAHSHAFLMHGVLSLTLMHDRYLSGASNTKLSVTEAFHWYQSTALFNEKLAGPIDISERDALWATAACLGTIAFFYLEAETLEEAWPLKAPSPMDLNWLSLSEGKTTLWKLTRSSGAKSVFQILSPSQNTAPQPTPPPTPPNVHGLEALPSEFIKLCGLDAASTSANNPYHAVASSLAKSLHSDCKLTTILSFLTFVMTIPAKYKELLKRKDPCALLLLAYWFAKMCQYPHWWIIKRASLEGQAICIYLQRYCGYDADIQKLVRYPMMMCGSVIC